VRRRCVHAVNLDSAFFALQALAPLLRDGGAMVALTSIAAHRGSFRHSHYASSKSGLVALVKSAAQELAPRGIRANCVSPGPVDTPMVRPLMQAQGENILRNTPLARIASPLDVAHAVLFLCSDWSTFITGQVLHVNGGQYIPG
jgi:3-oxoacyl-[acyl-carrier protein] reductase